MDRTGALFTPGRRLGWIFRDRRAAVQPFPQPRPWEAPEPGYEDHDLLRLRLDRMRTWSRQALVASLGPGLVAFGVGWLLAFPWGLLAALAPVGVAAVIGLVRMAWARKDLAGLEGRRVAVERDNAGRTADWEAERRAHLAAERARVEQLPEWFPTEVPDIGRLDLFGGTPAGWAGLVTVLGSSILGDGHELTVVDLSRAGVATDLTRLAGSHGFPVRSYDLPADLPRVNLLADLTTAQVVDVLVESIHHDMSDHGARTVDDRVLTSICGVLGARLTVGRIIAAARVLMDQPEPGSAELTARERYDLAETLFSDDYRRGIQVNLRRIEAHLAPLASLGDGAGGGYPGGLLSIATEPGTGALRSGLVRDLLVQWLIKRVSNGMQPAGSTVVIVAADGIAAGHLEDLAHACDRRGVHLVTLFRHLREDALQAIGTGAVAFMRLGNHTQASAAADFIGRRHRFVVTQLTRAMGRGRTTGQGSTYVPNWVETFSSAQQSNWSNTRSTQRVYEYDVEPTALQSIPEYALLLVTHTQGSAVLQAVECNPGIVLLPNFSLSGRRSIVAQRRAPALESVTDEKEQVRHPHGGERETQRGENAAHGSAPRGGPIRTEMTRT